jgi:hypothetical protein
VEHVAVVRVGAETGGQLPREDDGDLQRVGEFVNDRAQLFGVEWRGHRREPFCTRWACMPGGAAPDYNFGSPLGQITPG